jgi:hypothetical protein
MPLRQHIVDLESIDVAERSVPSPLGLGCFSFALLLITLLFEHITVRRTVEVFGDGAGHSRQFGKVSLISILQLVKCPSLRGLESALTGICIGEKYTPFMPYASHRSNCTTPFAAFR